MQAALCRQIGSIDQLKLEDIPTPVPNPHELLIEVKACGVSFADVLMVLGKYQVKAELPFIPGLEMAGLVKAVGAEVSGFKPGDWVFGRAKGCFAEELVTTPEFLWPLPMGLDYKIAAGFCLNYGTSWYGLHVRARLMSGETLLVLGASGGVGLAAVELGKLMGARVIACASSEARLVVCRNQGADETINYETDNLRESIRNLTNNRGVDVVFDAVGGKFTDLAIRSLAWGGRYLVVGFAAGQIPKVALNLPLLKGGSIVGVWWGGLTRADPLMARALMQQIVDKFVAGEIRSSVTTDYPLDKVRDALNDLANRRMAGKAIIDLQS